MKVAFYVAPGKFREETLVRAMRAGIEGAGDCFTLASNSTLEPADADVGVMVGMKASALREACVAAGQRVLVLDKGYDRKEDWWRVAIDAHQPTAYLMALSRPADRMDAAGWKLRPWRDAGDFVLIAGGGAKYHSVWNLSPPATWAQEMVDGIRAGGWKGRILYRPKPSQPDKTMPRGAEPATIKNFTEALAGAHAVVVFGSNACFEANCAGVPSIVLGDAVMRPISSRTLDEVVTPYCADADLRVKILSNLAYCQFREREWSTGSAWLEVRRQLEEVPAR